MEDACEKVTMDSASETVSISTDEELVGYSDKKAVLLQGNRAMRRVIYPVHPELDVGPTF